MKILNTTNKLGIATLLAASVMVAGAKQWTAGGSSQNWSDGANWSDATAPGVGDTLYFEDLLYTTGYTNLPGKVNNIVDVSTAVAAINYTAWSVPFSTTNHFYTTLIPSGVTLTINGLGDSSLAALVAGDIPAAGGWLSTGSATNYSTITGPGTLVVNDPIGLISVGWRTRATLDLSGLNTFNSTNGQIRIGATADNPTTVAPTGWFWLAKTNNITTTTSLTAPGILLGHGTNASGLGNMFLGQVNNFNSDGLVVGGRRSNTSSVEFAPNYSNSVPQGSFVLRGSAGGSAAASVFSIGDDSGNWNGYTSTYPNTSSSASGLADFSGGTVDILADTIFVGRNAIATIAQSGSGIGTLIVEHGTVTATNVFIAQRAGTNASTATGTLTLKGDAVMNVISNFTLGFRTNLLTSGGATGTLNVNDSAVLNVGGNFITGYSNNSTTLQTINIGSGQVNVAGLITNFPGSLAPTLNILGGTLKAGGSSVVIGALNGFGTITNIGNLTVTNSLILGLNSAASAGSAQIPGTLDVKGNLTLSNNYAVKMKLGSSLTPGGTTSDYLKVANNLSVAANAINVSFLGLPAVGAYDLINYAGTKTGSFSLAITNTTRNYTFALDQSVANHVKLNVAGGPPASITWKGGANGVWDLTNNLSWNNNTDKFYTYDSVLFDDTGSQTMVTLSGGLLQGGMTFNNSAKTYTLYDGGSAANKISGYGGLTKNGNGKLILYCTGSGHDWLGAVNINSGTLAFNNSSSAGVVQLGATNKLVTIASGATMELYGTTVGSGSIGYPVTFSGSGVGGIGAIVNTAPSSGSSLISPIFSLAGNATVSCVNATPRLTLQGAFLGSKLDLAGNTLTTTGLGYVLLDTLIATNSGNIQVNAPIFALRDVNLDGSGTLSVGSQTLALGTPNGTAWTASFGVNKSIAIGGGKIWAPASGGVAIPVGSAITLSGGLTVSNSQPINMSGAISGSYAVTKTGPAALTLLGTDTYSGNTIVSGGSLVFGATGSVASSPLIRMDVGCVLDVTAQAGGYTIPSGQAVQIDGSAIGNFNVPLGGTLQGGGVCAGEVAVNNGKVIPGILDIPGTLTLGSLALNNAFMTYELNSATTAGSGVNDLIVVNAGNLTFAGTTTIKIAPIGSLDTSGGQYTLFTYTGAPLPSSITNQLVLNSDTAYQFAFVDPATTPGSIQITVSGGSAGAKIWRGGVAGSPTSWDINTSSNWLDGGSPANFFNGDSVQFDDTGLTNVVDLVGNVRPVIITMNNNFKRYTIQGAGSLRAGAIQNVGASDLTIANAADNTLTGAGLFLINKGSVTFNQPTNATFTGLLNSSGSGSLVKQGTNQLTLTGTNGTTFFSPIRVNNGTLVPGMSNAFGAGTVVVTNNATVDLKGQSVATAIFSVSGSGVGGLGALNNTGTQQTNAITQLVLDNDTTLGAVGRWDLSPDGPSFMQGNNFNLTKVGAGSVFLGPKQDTSLSNIDITAGELAFAWNGTDLGSTGSVLVHSNAMLSFAYDIAAGTKPTTVLPGGIIGGKLVSFTVSTGGSGSYQTNFGTYNSYAGDINFNGRGLVSVANLAGLTLSGSIHGPAGLTSIDAGSLTLAGSNDYSGDLSVNYGAVYVASSNALPANTTVTVTSLTPNQPVRFGLVSNVVTPPSVTLNLAGERDPTGSRIAVFTGQGTWTGPLNLMDIQLDPSQFPQVTFDAATNLTISGPISQSGTPNVAMNISGFPGIVRFASPLAFGGTMRMGSQGLGLDPILTQWITVMELDSSNNNFTNMLLWRGGLIIGADNAIPTNCPITTSFIVTDNDHRGWIDLNGHVQTFANFPGVNSVAMPVWIGNNSTNGDSTVIFNSTITNNWNVWIVDNFTNMAPTFASPNPEAVTNKTGLSVTAGYLRLPAWSWSSGSWFHPSSIIAATNNAYTGPTLVSGGTLQVDNALGNTTTTVSGTGTLAGAGPFNGQVVINNGGTLSPGGTSAFVSAPGIMNNYTTLTLNAGSKAYLEVNLTANTNDSVRGLNSMVYNGGTLVITNVGAQAITNGTVFKLFYATNYTAGAVSVRPTFGLRWDTASLAVDGTVRAFTVNTNRTPITSTVSAGSLNLSWPSDHIGWRLQNQTNSLAVGITTNWFDVAGSSATNQVIAPINSDSPTVLFRLVYP